MNKVDNPARLTKRKRDIQIMNIRKENIITELLDIKGMIREHYKLLFMNKFNNLDEMSDSSKNTNYQTSPKIK